MVRLVRVRACQGGGPFPQQSAANPGQRTIVPSACVIEQSSRHGIFAHDISAGCTDGHMARRRIPPAGAPWRQASHRGLGIVAVFHSCIWCTPALLRAYHTSSDSSFPRAPATAGVTFCSDHCRMTAYWCEAAMIHSCASEAHWRSKRLPRVRGHYDCIGGRS